MKKVIRTKGWVRLCDLEDLMRCGGMDFYNLQRQLDYCVGDGPINEPGVASQYVELIMTIELKPAKEKKNEGENHKSKSGKGSLKWKKVQESGGE